MTDRPPLLVRILIVNLKNMQVEREYDNVNFLKISAKIQPGKQLTWWQSMATWALNNGMGIQIRNEKDGEPR